MLFVLTANNWSMSVDDIYISLIVRHLKDEASESEKEKLFSWVYSSAMNQQLYFNLKDIWETAEFEKATKFFSTDEEWERFVMNALSKEKNTYDSKKVHLAKIKRGIQIAAIILITFAVGFLVQDLFPAKESFAVVNVPYGAKSNIELPDGSKITINSGSTLRYPTDLSTKEVNLYLEGEAYFDIHRNVNRKVNVNTSTLTIQVLGTAFNVKAFEDEDVVEATLVRGSISVLGKVGNRSISNPIILKPNQQITLIKGETKMNLTDLNRKDKHRAPEKSVVNSPGKPIVAPQLNINEMVEVDDYISWKDNKLVFKNERFEDLALKLERWYNVEINIGDKNLEEARYTGVFEKETLEQAIQALSISLPFKYELDKNKINIYTSN